MNNGLTVEEVKELLLSQGFADPYKYMKDLINRKQIPSYARWPRYEKVKHDFNHSLALVYETTSEATHSPIKNYYWIGRNF